MTSTSLSRIYIGSQPLYSGWLRTRIVAERSTKLASVYSGDLSGSGIIHISTGGVVPYDVNTWVKTIGPRIRMAGTSPHRTFKFVGWMQFLQTSGHFTGAPQQAVSKQLYFNSESEDLTVGILAGNLANDFYYFIAPGCVVAVNVST